MKYTGQSSLSQIFQLIKSKFDGLSAVANTGDYNDLSNLPDIETTKFLRVDTIVSADSSNRISIPFVLGEYENVMVYLNGLLLIEGTHYTVNADNTISLPDYVANQGDVFTFINKTLSSLELEIKADAKTSESWAIGGTGIRSGEDTNNSKYWSQQSKNSEVASKASETNAKASENAAAGSASAAKSSENNAASSATASANSASASETSENNAKASETAAKTSETNSKNSENASKTSETNAKSSEGKAKTSETNAKTSETNATNKAKESADSAIESQSWAIGGTGTRENEDTNNAKYWYQKAYESSNVTDVIRITPQEFTPAERFVARQNTDAQVLSMPTASAAYSGQILQYVGEDTAEYRKGYSYICVTQSGSYVWKILNTSAETKVYISLPTANWSGDPSVGLFTQVIQVANTTPRTRIDLVPDHYILEALTADKISHLYIKNDNGVLTAIVTGKQNAPTSDLTVQATLVEMSE